MSHRGCQLASISDDELAQIDLAMFCAKQDDLIMAPRERIQIPHSWSFCMEDLVWTYHVTSGKRKYKTSMLVIIIWNKLDDLIKGEQHYAHFPCKYTKEI